MGTSTWFWNRIAERYARQPVADEAAYQTKLQRTRERLTPDMQVFEFGCGTGTTALIHAPHVARIDAIDVSANMLDIARRKAADAGIDNVHFSQASIESAALPDAHYDMVMAHSILHLLDDRAAALARIHRTLKPGGLFVSSTVCIGGSTTGRVNAAGVSFAGLFGLLPTLHAITARTLLDELARAGFVIEHEWRPGGRENALFIIARKPDTTTSG